MATTSRRFFLSLAALTLLISSLNCTINFGGGNTALQGTQTALVVLETRLAIQNSGLNATGTAQGAAPSSTAIPQVIQPTQPPVMIQPVLPPLDAPAPTLVVTEAPLPTEAPPQATEPPPPVDIEAQMKTASILVYEDIVTDPTEYQYVKRTLDSMGLNYQWDGNAVGRLKSHMLAGGPQGKPWDLVILAIETRETVSGEYFEYLSDILNQGTSVILEAWHLDSVSEGAITPTLGRCGVMVYPYVPETGSTNDVVVWTLPGISHPVMLEPNSGMTFTKARDKWIPSFDLGSQMALTGQGDAQLLMGTDATEPNEDGVLAVCLHGQLILQTFSSHSFTFQTMYPLWHNYIYNALRTRFTGGE